MVSRVMCLGKSGSFFLNSTPHHLNLPSPLLANIGYRHRAGAKYKISVVHSDTASAQKVLEKEQEKPSDKWKVKMVYDGECLLCMGDVNFGQYAEGADERFGTIKFMDIGSSNYSPEENEGLDYKTVDACENDACRM